MILARRSRTAAVGLAVVLVLAAASAEQLNKLKPEGYVNDFAHVLDGRTSSDIYQLCSQIDQQAGAQIAVVTIHSLEGLEASDFGNRLFAQWGVGHKDNRGVLILLAVDDHKYWVEVGYGLEPILNDAKVGDFGREMVPFLKRGDYNSGVLLLTQRVAAVIAQDRGLKLPPQTPIQAPARTHGRGSDNDFPVGLILFLIVVVFSVFAAILRGIWRFLVFLFTGKRPPPRRGWFGAAPGGFWIGGGGGGGWSGGFGGGGGFGGFGGGMSGGGGAGGSW